MSRDPVRTAARGRVALGAAAWALFVVITLVVIAWSDTVTAWDARALRAVATLRGPVLDQLMIGVTSLGAALVLGPACLIYVVVLRAHGGAQAARQLLIVLAGAVVADNLIKLALARPRPQVVPHLVGVSTYSYPSGHSLTTAAVVGTIALLLARRPLARGVRALTWSLAAAVILGVGASRVYLGVHNPSDVVAGLTFGAGWALIVDGAIVLMARSPGSSGRIR